jgi:hypothetical protein
MNTDADIPIPKPTKRRTGPKGAFRRPTLAAYLDWSTSAVDRADASGRLPRAVKVGGIKFWPRRWIDLWLMWGCPDREAFHAMLAAHQAARARRVG